MNETCTVIPIERTDKIGKDIRLCLPADLSRKDLDGFQGRFELHLVEYEVVILAKTI